MVDMDVHDLADMVGKQAQLVVDRGKYDLYVDVEITGAKPAYGRTLCEVTPVRGTGEAWVSIDALVFEEDSN